jgi:hypothetical protein
MPLCIMGQKRPVGRPAGRADLPRPAHGPIYIGADPPMGSVTAQNVDKHVAFNETTKLEKKLSSWGTTRM